MDIYAVGISNADHIFSHIFLFSPTELQHSLINITLIDYIILKLPLGAVRNVLGSVRSEMAVFVPFSLFVLFLRPREKKGRRVHREVKQQFCFGEKNWA